MIGLSNQQPQICAALDAFRRLVRCWRAAGAILARIAFGMVVAPLFVNWRISGGAGERGEAEVSKIQITSKLALLDFLRNIARRLPQFRLLIICTPFVDESGLKLLHQLLVQGPEARCRVKILTMPGPARALRSRLPRPERFWSDRVFGIYNLHAKACVAVGREFRDSRALITSANLTQMGSQHNFELGAFFTGKRPQGRQMVTNIVTQLDRLIRDYNTTKRKAV